MLASEGGHLDVVRELRQTWMCKQDEVRVSSDSWEHIVCMCQPKRCTWTRVYNYLHFTQINTSALHFSTTSKPQKALETTQLRTMAPKIAMLFSSLVHMHTNNLAMKCNHYSIISLN